MTGRRAVLPTPRWAWLIGSLLSVAVVWRCEATRRARRPPATEEQGQQLELPGQRATAAWLRGRARARLRSLLTPRPGGKVSVSGRVHDTATDDPVPDATVVFGPDLTTHSDEQGRYAIDLPRGQYRPIVDVPGSISLGRLPASQQPYRPRADQLVERAGGAAPVLTVSESLYDVDLEVVRSAVVRGHVRDAAGRPIAGVLVRAEAEETPDVQPVLGTNLAETDANGEYQLTVAATAQQVTPFHDQLSARERPIVDLDPGEERPLDLTMVAGCIVSGRVMIDGRPAAGGQLERASSLGNDGAFTSAGVEIRDGRYLWTTDEEAIVVLRAFPTAEPQSEAQPFDCHDGAGYEWDFAIESGPTKLSGTVVDARGREVAGAMLELDKSPGPAPARKDHADSHGHWAFRDTDLPPGEYRVVAKAPGLGIAVAHVTLPQQDIQLRLSGTGSLTGTTRGLRDGTFMLEVRCTESPGYWKHTEERFLAAARDGSFSVEGVPACKAEVTPRSTFWQAKPVTVEIPSGGPAEVELDLSPLIRKQVHGTVRDAAGQAVPGALVRVVDQPGLQVLADHDGAFSIRGAPGAVLVVTGGAVTQTIRLTDDPLPACDLPVVLDPATATR